MLPGEPSLLLPSCYFLLTIFQFVFSFSFAINLLNHLPHGRPH